jgi:hypothetical protein
VGEAREKEPTAPRNNYGLSAGLADILRLVVAASSPCGRVFAWDGFWIAEG